MDTNIDCGGEHFTLVESSVSVSIRCRYFLKGYSSYEQSLVERVACYTGFSSSVEKCNSVFAKNFYFQICSGPGGHGIHLRQLKCREREIWSFFCSVACRACREILVDCIRSKPAFTVFPLEVFHL